MMSDSGMKLKRKYTPRKSREPSARERAVAKHLAQGATAPNALRRAGYPESVVRCRAAKIARSEAVRRALIQAGESITGEHLGAMAKARLEQDLLSPPKGDKGAKSRNAFYRTAGEMAGIIGGPAEVHLHSHATLPPVVQRMLEEKMRELLAQKETAITVEALPAETAQATEQPQPIE